MEPLPELVSALSAHGFSQVSELQGVPDAVLLLKRQTWNTNRAVVVVTPAQVPADFAGYLTEVRKRVAFRCKFVPFFWGIGIQVVVVAPGLQGSGIDPSRHVASVDNQWAIVQSVFLVDPGSGTFRVGRTWGQFVTGKFQNAIAGVLGRHFAREE